MGITKIRLKATGKGDAIILWFKASLTFLALITILSFHQTNITGYKKINFILKIETSQLKNLQQSQPA